MVRPRWSALLALLLCISVAAACAAPPAPPYRPPAGRVLYSRAGVDLWYGAPDGSGRTQLTRDGATSGDGYLGGRWSPDGSLVAAERSIANESGNALFLVGVASGRAERLTRPGTFLDGYVWSPDGRYLAYGELTSGGTLASGGSLSGGVGDVRLYDVRDRTTRVLGPGNHPSFAPDGKTVGYAHVSGALALVDLASGTTSYLTTLADLSRRSAAIAPKGMGLIGGPVWSHDGALVAYAAIERGPILEALQIVYVQEAKPFAPTKQWSIGKTGAVHHVAELRWSPSARTLGYAIINAQPHHHWIGTISPDSPELHPLFDSVPHFLDFAWAPDGSSILLQLDDEDAWIFLDPRGTSATSPPRLRVAPGGWRPDWCSCGAAER